jgi:DNA-binding CsgD family transcriptional regulator
MAAAYKATERNRERAKTLAEAGLSVAQIADAMGISYNTCVAYHKEDMRQGRAHGIANITDKVYQQAANGCRQSQKLYLASVAGWSDKITIKGDPSAPIQHEHQHTVTVDASNAIGALMEQLATAKAKGTTIIDVEAEAVPVPAIGGPPVKRNPGRPRIHPLPLTTMPRAAPGPKPKDAPDPNLRRLVGVMRSGDSGD